MTHNKKPVVIVAVVLSALIVLPIAVWMLSGSSEPSLVGNRTSPDAKANHGLVVDFDLRQLADKAEKLLAQDLADALRKGDVSLDFMADLNREADKGRSALAAGKLDKAEKYYSNVVSAAENRLGALGLAQTARALNASTYAELKRLEYLQAAFENTYREAVETYNQALRELNAASYEESVNGFEMTGAILGDLEGRAIQQIGGILESANKALENYDLATARAAYAEVLRMDAANGKATDGLVMVSALDGIAPQVKAIKALETKGRFNEALEQLDALLAKNPNNPFLRNQRRSLEARILERDYAAFLASAASAQAAGDLDAAIAALESAIALRPGAELNARLEKLKAEQQAARLETLLSNGYDALKLGRYEAARQLYREAVDLAPDSKEARTGLEKASSLYLANIRYSQNLSSATKYLKEGRYPLAAKIFNSAMTSRPSNVPLAQVKEETRIRNELKSQSQEVSLVIESDKRTYVSLIGVFSPDRFADKELNLFPDVYKLKGTRKGYKEVEIELKVDARNKNQIVEVVCSEKL
jgi:tetratricopeptide (TPR) repeat protein